MCDFKNNSDIYCPVVVYHLQVRQQYSRFLLVAKDVVWGNQVGLYKMSVIEKLCNHII